MRANMFPANESELNALIAFEDAHPSATEGQKDAFMVDLRRAKAAEWIPTDLGLALVKKNGEIWSLSVLGFEVRIQFVGSNVHYWFKGQTPTEKAHDRIERMLIRRRLHLTPVEGPPVATPEPGAIIVIDELPRELTDEAPVAEPVVEPEPVVKPAPKPQFTVHSTPPVAKAPPVVEPEPPAYEVEDVPSGVFTAYLDGIWEFGHAKPRNWFAFVAWAKAYKKGNNSFAPYLDTIHAALTGKSNVLLSEKAQA